MTTVTVRAIDDDLSFGARVGGVTLDHLRDPEVRDQLVEAFDERGLLIFEEVDPTPEMQVAISTVFGPLKDHPSSATPRVGGDDMVGVIEIRHDPEEGGVVELDGQRLSQWLPWHFDHCYNDQLNRAGVLRAVEIPPDGGRTGFVDGIALYGAVAPAVRDRIEGEMVIYAMDVILDNLRFGRPDGFVEVAGVRRGHRRDDRVRGATSGHPPGGLDPALRGEGPPRLPLDGEGHRRPGRCRGRAAAHRHLRRDRRGGEGPQLLPPLGADRHGHLGQLAGPPLGVGLGARARSVHAPHDHRR